MNRYAFVIPTKDRPECVEFYLKTQGSALASAGFDVIICDSSENSKTRDVVASYKVVGLNIVYNAYLEKGATDNVDEKGFALCKKYCGQYDYLWLCSDGTVIDVARAMESIEQDLIDGKDLIVLSDVDILPYSDKKFHDVLSLCRELCWRMTLLGSTVVSGKLLQQTVSCYPYQEADCGTLWLPTAYFKQLACRPFCATYHCVKDIFYLNPHKKGSFWYLSGNVLCQWGQVWCDTIDSLPMCFEPIRAEVLFSHDRYMRVFSIWNLPRLKTSGNLTLSKALRYRKYLKRVTHTPFIFFVLQAILPAEPRLIDWLRLWKKRLFTGDGQDKRNTKE